MDLCEGIALRAGRIGQRIDRLLHEISVVDVAVIYL